MTAIVELTNGITMSAWLCGKHQAARRGAGWTVKAIGTVKGFCDDCERARQLEPGYLTPTVDYMPTTPDAFCPAPGWKPDEPIAPWPAVAKKKAGWQRIETEFLGPALADMEAIESKKGTR